MINSETTSHSDSQTRLQREPRQIKGSAPLRLAICLRLLAPLALGTVLIALVASLTGCHAAHTGQRSPRPDPTPVIAAHTAKDAAITDSAGRIDELAKPTKAAVPIRAETDRIREQIATAPASDLATITHAYARELDARDGAIAALQVRLDKEELKARRAYKRWLYGAATALLVGFTLSVVFGKAAAAARTWPLGLLGLGAITLAEILGTTWFQIGCLVLLASALVYATIWVVQKHRDGTLAQKVDYRLEGFREVIATLDAAYEEASDEVKRIYDRSVFNRLSDKLRPEIKAQIHEIRAESTLGKEAAHA